MLFNYGGFRVVKGVIWFLGRSVLLLSLVLLCCFAFRNNLSPLSILLLGFLPSIHRFGLLVDLIITFCMLIIFGFDLR